MGKEGLELKDSLSFKLIGPDGKLKPIRKKESKIDKMLNFLLKILEEPG